MASSRTTSARFAEGVNKDSTRTTGHDHNSQVESSQHNDSAIAERLTRMLDQVEMRVELLRQNAIWMEQEKDALQSMIQTIQGNKDLSLIREGEREEIQINANRLLSRLLTVDVTVTTLRNENQERALETVNRLIDEMLVKFKTDEEGSRRMLQTYLNACAAEALGPVDQKFQQVIIECTADDQKKVRVRLETLLSSNGLKQ